MTELAEHASHFWRWRGGTYSWPGRQTENYIRWDTPNGCFMLHGESNQTRLLPCPPNNAAPSWPAAPSPRCKEAGCAPWLWFSEAPEAGDSHVITLHTCAVANSAADGCVNRTALLGGDRLEVDCTSCPSNSPAAISGGAALLTTTLLMVMAMPVVAMCLLRRLWRHTQNVQWPQRRRPLLVLVVFELSWIITVLGLTPTILWEVGRWWPHAAVAWTPLSVLGVIGMLLNLRSDDPPALLQATTVGGILAAIALAYAFVLNELDRVYREASNDVAWQMPWSTCYEVWADELPSRATRYWTLAVACLFTVPSQARVLVSQRCGGVRGPAAFTHLWRTIRAAIFAIGVASITCGAVGVVGSLVCTPSTVVVEKRGRESIVLLTWLGGMLIVAFVLTAPRRRLALHLGSCHLLRARYTPLVRAIPAQTAGTGESKGSTSGTTDSGLECVCSGANSALAIEAIEMHSLAHHDQMTPATTPAEFYPTIPSPASSQGSEHPILQARVTAATGGTFRARSPRDFVLHCRQMGLLHTDWRHTSIDVLDVWDDASGKFEGLTLSSPLGFGGYSMVVEASHGGQSYAVKIFSLDAYKNEDEVRRFSNEVRFAQELRHPNICMAHGTLLLPGPWPALVLELLHGSLYHLLHKRKADSPPLLKPFKARTILEVARGLEYLHSKNVMHRDIKTANVLLTADLHAKISDFGIATRFGMENTPDTGTTRYMAPEVIFGRPYNHSADVYSFGMLMWEVMHEATPFGQLSSIASITRTTNNGRPTCAVPSKCCAEEAALIGRCWHMDPAVRPPMQEVVSSLEAIVTTEGDASALEGPPA